MDPTKRPSSEARHPFVINWSRTVTACVLIAVLLPSQALFAGLLAYYPFDDDVADQSWNSNGGYLTGGSFTTEGYRGSAIEFNGVNEFATLLVDISPALLPELTMGAWVNTDRSDRPPYGTVVSQDPPDAQGSSFGFGRTIGYDDRGAGTTPDWSAFTGNRGSGVNASGVDVVVGDWVFLAAAYDQKSGKMTLYVNDQQIPAAAFFAAGTTTVGVGRNPGHGAFFDGRIDEVFFYDEALTREQIDDIRINGIVVPEQEGISLRVGETYVEDFDSMGHDGLIVGQSLPTGWFGGYKGHRIQETVTSFPAPHTRTLPQGMLLYNAGGADESDRTLALGVGRDMAKGVLELVGDVSESAASGFQLSFDLEAWDAAAVRTLGEAAFDVKIEIDSGEGFVRRVDLGRVSTGTVLEVPATDNLDGNSDANRIFYDSGVVQNPIPADSRLRVLWSVPRRATASENWIYGLDNVSLTLFADALNSILGDFDNDGALTAADIDLLSGEIRSGGSELGFDLNSDGAIDLADHGMWVSDHGIANTFLGDADLNGAVDFSDFLALSAGFGETGGWAAGDFDGDGVVEFPDFLLMSANFGATSAAAMVSVPEPSGMWLLCLGCFQLSVRKRRVRFA